MEEDIIYGILSRLPIKSLARFRCVCKSWSKYINDPYLHTIHVKEEPTPIMFQRFPRGKIIISFLRGARKEPVLELCDKSPNSEHLLLGSCNGLTLVSYERDPCKAGIYRFAVINPLSKQRYDLPSLSIKIRPKFMQMDGPCDAAGIGFDDSTNTLKTVFIILKGPGFDGVSTTTMVHTSGMSSWRKVAQFPAYVVCGDGIFGHGRLHWSNDATDDETKIVWFDVKKEEFGLSDPPEPINPIEEGYAELVDLNGEVGFAYVSPICIKLWILKQEEEWVLHCCFDFNLIPGQYFYCHVEILGCWNNDGDILLTCEGGERLFVYSLESGDLRQVLERQYGPFRMYQSSLFSLHTSAYYSKAIRSRVRGARGELRPWVGRPAPWKRGKKFHRKPGT